MKRIAFVLAAVLLLTGCAASFPNETMDYAPRENQLTVWTCLEPTVYEPLVKEFEERSGIWVQVKTGAGSELIRNLAEESCDLLLGLDVIAMDANKDLFQPYSLESDINFVEKCPVSDRWVPLSLNQAVFVYNPKLVRHNMPRDWNDLLSDIWREQVAFADPFEESFSLLILEELLLQNPSLNGQKVFSALRANVKTLSGNTEEIVSRLISGTDALAILPADIVQRKIRDGGSLMVEESLDMCLTADGAAIPVNAAHVRNANAFIQFLLCTDAQKYAEFNSYRGPVLASLANYPLDARYPSVELANQKQQNILELWREVWEVER